MNRPSPGSSLPTFLNKYVEKPHRELGKKKLFYGGGDRLLFTTPVGELARRALVTAPEDISIREATEIMAKNQISSLVLMNPLGLPAGIITNKDLRDKVVSKGRDTGQPVKKIQSVSLVKAEAGEPCIEALFKMIHYNIHHLLVLDNGRVKGLVTTHDLMKLQGASPISIVREIEERLSLEGLASPARKIQDLVGTFLREGVKSAQILRIITEIHDRLLRRLIELVEKKLGPPPRPYCFLSLGESGRKEQAFLDAQDWALLYADSPSPAEEKESKDYFLRFSSLVRQTLEGMGLPPAPGGGSGRQAPPLPIPAFLGGDFLPMDRPGDHPVHGGLPGFFRFPLPVRRCLPGRRTAGGDPNPPADRAGFY